MTIFRSENWYLTDFEAIDSVITLKARFYS